MHRFLNFKGFAEASIDLFRPFTILVGPNGSGKSNTIEAVELLSFIARGRPLHEVSNIGRGDNGFEIRGGLQACPRYGHDSFSLGFGASANFMGDRRKILFYMVEICAKPYPQIIAEKLYLDDRMFFETVERPPSTTSSDIQVRFNNFSRGGKKPQRSVSANRSILSQYRDFVRVNERYHRACLNLVETIMRYLRSSFVFDPKPRLMRNYERIGNNILSRDGSNLSAVLYALKTGDKEQVEALNRLLGWISQLPDEPYMGFNFVTTELGDVMLEVMEDDEHSIDARVLSDGTLRTLAILTALETSERGSRIFIEEFDNGLHPSRVKVLTEAVQDCCERRELNVLVTTHNPATLNELKPEQLEGVVLCTWDKEQKASNLIGLEELPRADELLERGRLGDLVTRRVLEKHLVPDFEEEYKRRALEWIKALP